MHSATDTPDAVPPPAEPRRRRAGRPASRRGDVPQELPGHTGTAPSAHPADRWTWQHKLLHAANRLYVHGYHRLQVQTPPTIPNRGPAILVCNHISGLDPLLIQAAVPRVVVWMMAAEYYRLPGLNWVFRSINAIPVERSGRDMAATRAALRALADGRVLGLFPEGKIATRRELLPFQTGVAMIAARAGVPVYPTYLDGSNRGMEMLPAFLTPNEVRVRFGPPVHLPDEPSRKPDLNIFTGRIQASVTNLKYAMGC